MRTLLTFGQETKNATIIERCLRRSNGKVIDYVSFVWGDWSTKNNTNHHIPASMLKGELPAEGYKETSILNACGWANKLALWGQDLTAQQVTAIKNASA